MNEKELNRLFKEKLSQPSQEFNPDNWKAMEAMLDKAKAARRAYWSQSIAILAFAFFAGTVALWDSPSVDQSPAVAPNTSDAPHIQTPDIPEISPYTEPQETVATEPNGNEEGQASAETPPGEEHSAVNSASPSNAQAPSGNQAEASPAANEENVAAAPFTGSESPEVLTLPKLKSKKWAPLSSSGLTMRDAPNIALRRPTGRDGLPVLKNPHYQHHFYLVAGPQMHNVYDGKRANGGWTAGLSYGYRLSSRMEMQLGVLFSQTSNLGISAERDTSFFDLGRKEVRETKNYQELYSVRFPLDIRYNLGQGHSVSGGAFVDVITGLHMHYHRESVDFKGVRMVDSDDRMVADDVSDYNSGFRLGYQFQWSPKWSAGLQYNQGLTDVLPSNWGSLNRSDRHQLWQLQFLLQYRLL